MCILNVFGTGLGARHPGGRGEVAAVRGGGVQVPDHQAGAAGAAAHCRPQYAVRIEHATLELPATLVNIG